MTDQGNTKNEMKQNFRFSVSGVNSLSRPLAWGKQMKRSAVATCARSLVAEEITMTFFSALTPRGNAKH